MKGTGLANTCPTIGNTATVSTNPKDLKPGNYKMDKFCLEPTEITVKAESQARRRAACGARGFLYNVWWQRCGRRRSRSMHEGLGMPGGPCS